MGCVNDLICGVELILENWTEPFRLYFIKRMMNIAYRYLLLEVYFMSEFHNCIAENGCFPQKMQGVYGAMNIN